MAINAAFSIAFCWLVFGGTSYVAVSAVILDAVPQSVMIAFMSVIVPITPLMLQYTLQRAKA